MNDTKQSTQALRGIMIVLMIIAGMLLLILLEVRERVPLSGNGSSRFTWKADKLLDDAKVEELFEISSKRTKDVPLDAYGHWYLGRAYFLMEDWSNAYNSLNKATDLEPTFEGWLLPYLRVIEAKKNLQHSPNNGFEGTGDPQAARQPPQP